jgi:4-methyl-5(b-hydroxyethyl)-thiazole monophosphate biosynthesis
MKGLLVFSHNMEDLESLGTKALLTRAGLKLTTITFNNTLDIVTAFGTQIKADMFGWNTRYDDYDFVVIPGGRYVNEVIEKDTEIQKIVKYFDAKEKLVAAICAAPRFLGRAGLLNGRSYTAFTGSDEDIPKGIYLPSMKAVRDKNIITARSAGSVYEFAYEIVNYLLGEEKAKALFSSILF